MLHQKIKEQIAAVEVGSQMEVVNTFGRADIVSQTEVIEISNINGYKEAYGRVLAYTGSPTFAGRGLRPRLHLFCDESTSQHTFEKVILQISELCRGRVRLTFGNLSVFTKCETTVVAVPTTAPVVCVPQMQRQSSIQSVSKKFDRFKNNK